MFYFLIFLLIFVRSIMSTFTGPIFMKFAGLVELWSSEVIIFDISRDVVVATGFHGKIDLQCAPCSWHDIR